MQVGKLKVYHLVLHNRRSHHTPGTLPKPLGPLPLQSRGFMLTTVTLVMGGAASPAGRQGGGEPGEDRARTLPLASCLRAASTHGPRLRDLRPGLCLRGRAAMPDATPPHAAGGGEGPHQVLWVERNVPRARCA